MPRLLLLVPVTVLLLVAGCGSGTTHHPTATGWVDQAVTFQADGLTVHGTYRHPTSGATRRPAALLIAGSGPTDQNGNSAIEPGPIDTLSNLADQLGDDGVATLRYDKLGTGATGLGSYAADPSTVGVAPFEDESQAALRFLASQSGVVRSRLAVVGHSEGAAYALLLATTPGLPAIHALALLEPQSARTLDVISQQIDGQIATAEQAGRLQTARGDQLRTALATAVTSLRTTGTVPADLPKTLATALPPTAATYLAQWDRVDPAALAARLRPGTPVLVSCSANDAQISCADTERLVAGLHQGRATVDVAHLTDVDHDLKQDSTPTGAEATKAVPFSPQLVDDLRTFAGQHL